jgi:hypothetical protein
LRLLQRLLRWGFACLSGLLSWCSGLLRLLGHLLQCTHRLVLRLALPRLLGRLLHLLLLLTLAHAGRQIALRLLGLHARLRALRLLRLHARLRALSLLRLRARGLLGLRALGLLGRRRTHNLAAISFFHRPAP